MSAPRGVSFTEPRCRPADLARCLEAARDLAPWLGPAVAEAFHRLRAPRQGRGFHVGSLSLALALRAPSTSPARPLQGKRGAEVARANALACALLWSCLLYTSDAADE